MKRNQVAPVTVRIDSDLLVFSAGFGAESSWRKEGNEDSPPPFDKAREMLDMAVANITFEAGGEGAIPILYLTGSTNFRDNIATIQPYKGNRDESKKPFHFLNLRAYIAGAYDYRIQEPFEADDLMAMDQIGSIIKGEGDSSIIASRDKDLKMVDGWHYSWEMGKQPAFGPFYVEGYGEISLDTKRKLKGYGRKFFLAQCIMGDRTDNIQGIPGAGDVGAFECLALTTSYLEGLEAVREAYEGFYGHSGDSQLLENGRLLWMTCGVDEKGDPILWSF